MRGKGGPDNASCKYKGVRQRTWGRWVSEISEPSQGKRIWLGSFEDAKSAAVAYDRAAIEIFGPTAKVNFPESLAQVSLPVHATAFTSVDPRLSMANAEPNFPGRLPEVSRSISATSVEATADQRLSRDMLDFLDKLCQMAVPFHTTASRSVDGLFNQEGTKFPEKGIIDMQVDEYPPWGEVSLIANPYACLINDHVYDYYGQLKLQERLRSVAPTDEHGEFQAYVVKNDVHLIEKHDDIKENMRVELPGYADSSLYDEAMITSFGKSKDPGVIIAGKSEEVGIDDWGGDLSLINFWF